MCHWRRLEDASVAETRLRLPWLPVGGAVSLDTNGERQQVNSCQISKRCSHRSTAANNRL